MDLRLLRRALDLARYWRLTLNLFYHPVYLATYPACATAIRGGLDYLEEKGVVALHCGPDELTNWWLARGETRLRQTAEGFAVKCDWPGGCIVRRVWEGAAPRASAGGVECRTLVREAHGLTWLYVAVPSGEHEVVLG